MKYFNLVYDGGGTKKEIATTLRMVAQVLDSAGDDEIKSAIDGMGWNGSAETTLIEMNEPFTLIYPIYLRKK